MLSHSGLRDRSCLLFRYGEHMDLSRHEQGTEIKAITLHGMEIDKAKDGDRCDIHFLIDI